jgi:hypothetical protein
MTTRIQKYLIRLMAVAIAAFLLSGFSVTTHAQDVLSETVWSIEAAAVDDASAWFRNDNNTRGIAYNKATGNLLIFSRSGGLKPVILDAATGDSLGALDVTGISGGTFPASLIDVSPDGRIFAANLTTNAETSPLRVYSWANETAAPKLIYSGDVNGLAVRYGDSFRADFTDGASTLYVGGSGNPNLAKLTYNATEDTVSAVQVFNFGPVNNLVLRAVRGMAPIAGQDSIWVNEFDYELRKMSTITGGLGALVPATVFPTKESLWVDYAAVGDTRLAAVFPANLVAAGQSASIIDLNTGAEVAYTAAGPNNNGNGAGGPILDVENKRMYLLATNNKIAAYDISAYLPGDEETVTVTFRVNTATVPDTLRGSDNVFMRGAFRPGATGDWQEGSYYGQEISWGTTLPMTSAGGDYWVRELVMAKGDQIQWKYFPQFATGANTNSPDDGWESDPTRTFTVPMDADGPIVLDLAYWNRGIPFVAEQDSLTMFFRVNVGNDVALGRLDPANPAHRVGVRGVPEVFGNPADWSATAFYLDAEPVRAGSANYFYSGALRLPKADLPAITGQFPYKFVVEGTSVQWDDNPGFPDGNRFAPLSAADSTLRWVFFQNNAPPLGEIVSASLQFAVNVGVLEELGYFNRGLGDDVTIPGGFNGWDTGTAASYNSALDVWTAAFDVTESVGSNVAYKYYVRWDESRFDSDSPNYIPRLDAGNGWEEPGLTGGSDRIYTFTNETVQQVDDFGSGVAYFNGIPPQGVIGETISGETVLTTRFVVDMTAALTHDDPFDPDNDELYVIFETPFFGLSQGLTVGDNLAILEEGNEEEAARVRMSPLGQNNLWELELDILLPTENHMGFVIAYVKPDGDIISNGGGFGPGRRYYRYIEPLDISDPDDILWPDSDELDLIVWRPGEDLDFPVPPSYGLTSNIGENIREVVDTFRLYQNYPNPFNPTTNISYTVPQSSDVRIDVFNVLGQRVATLVNGRVNAGTHTVQFDARSFASGMYLYRIQAGDFVSTRQMMLIK